MGRDYGDTSRAREAAEAHALLGVDWAETAGLDTTFALFGL